jgi:hypothetical protein
LRGEASLIEPNFFFPADVKTDFLKLFRMLPLRLLMDETLLAECILPEVLGSSVEVFKMT